jgi:hypothetical protein
VRLSDDFDAAARRQDRKRMYCILIQIGMKEKSAAFVVDSTLPVLIADFIGC